MKTMLSIGVGLFAMTMCASFASGAAAQGSANFAQVDLSGPVICPANPPGGTQWTAVPLSVALTTAGGPVWLSVTLNVETVQTANPMTFQAVVDGVPRESITSHIFTEGVLVFERLYYPLAAGGHTFSGRVSCVQDNHMTSGWLTVYELPLIKK